MNKSNNSTLDMHQKNHKNQKNDKNNNNHKKSILQVVSNMLSSKWAIPVSVIIGYLLQFTNETIISNAWATSLFFKSMIMTGLPFIMFAILSSGLLSIRENGNKIIMALFLMTFAINVVTFLFLYPVGYFTDIFHANTTSMSSMSMTKFDPAWKLTTPIILRSDLSILLSFITWIASKRLSPKFYDEKVLPIAKKASQAGFVVLGKIFSPAIYIFIIGFIANLQIAEFVWPMIQKNYPILFISVSSHLLFIIIMIGFSHGIRRALKDISNLMPAFTVGFTTMSSGMAFPKTCEGLRASGIRENVMCVLPSVLIPSTIADGFMISSLIFFISSLFGIDTISFYTFFIGSMYYAIFKFSSCCMPGGTIMCVMPMLVSVFGFNDEMCTLIASMCLIFDGFITAGNVLGHGAFAILFNRIFGKFMDSQSN